MTTIQSPYYLWRLVHETTNIEKLFITPTDTSSYTSRYNRFVITETSGTEILTSGTVNLQSGIYKYEVYEQVSASNLLISNTTSLVEQGLLKVVATSDNQAFIEPSYTERIYTQ